MKRVIIVLAAGQGTRMKSPRAKVLHPFMGRTILEHLLESLRTIHDGPLLVVVGHQADRVAPLLVPFDTVPILQEPQRGTGHALMACRPTLSEIGPCEVLLVPGDAPLLPVPELDEFWDLFSAEEHPLALVTLEMANPAGYGRILRGAVGRVEGIVEERDATQRQRSIREVNAGVYFFRSPDILGLLDELRTNNVQGEYYLTDVVAELGRSGRPAAAFSASDPDLYRGINSQEELALAIGRLRQGLTQGWMAEGVTILDPSSVWIEPGVRLEPGVLLHSGVHLCGETHLERNVEVRPYSVLRSCHLGEGTLVREHCVLEGTRCGPGCIIGPFCRTREGTVAGAAVHLGNFVETKKASLGDRVKANHLSYLGDATVGEGSNIGAGTITCNYDGVNKHPTVLGERVFVGSDTQFVAPVKVGDDAYIGAGTTVTKDVPASALAISRSPQKIVEGWAERKRARARDRKPDHA